MASSTPTSYRSAVQQMVVGNVYPAGRNKFEPTSKRGLIPGIQLGLNFDLARLLDALSLGLIFKPVTGFAISGGGMIFARGSAPAAADGTQSKKCVFLPYVGVSLNVELFNSIKSVADSSKSKE